MVGNMRFSTALIDEAIDRKRREREVKQVSFDEAYLFGSVIRVRWTQKG